ncbi:hypothetical protein AHiyo8_39860 [Arthrobacter sp. Hiyo8]|nr:hypothetical protein AHiyo8_39860 [Arthrobacter sp. Hiyo8]
MDALEFLATVGGVARVGLLRASGYTPSAIRKLASAGAHQPRKGVWALPSADQEYLTAILNNGHVTCASAALRYGLWIKDKPMRVHLATRHCRAGASSGMAAYAYLGRMPSPWHPSRTL